MQSRPLEQQEEAVQSDEAEDPSEEEGDISGGESRDEYFSRDWVNANKKAICQSWERLTGMGPV